MNKKPLTLAASAVVFSCFIPAMIHGVEALGNGTPKVSEEVSAIVSSQTFVRNSPNADAHFQNADLMGNGDLLVSTRGTPDAYVFNVCKNDFWLSRLKSPGEWATPMRAGEIRFSIPSLAGASYRQEQDLYQAELRGIFAKGENRIQIVSRVTATAGNYLVVEVQNQGASPCSVVMETIAPHTDFGRGAVTTERAGVDEPGQIAWVERETPKHEPAHFIMKCAMAAKIFGAPCTLSVAGSSVSAAFSVPAGATVTAVIAINVTGNQMPLTLTPADPVPGALGLLTNVKKPTIVGWNAAHRGWWKDYWNKSYIQIPRQALLEKYYYGWLYILASSNRDGKMPAGIWGWNGTDDPDWCGDYHLDYNIQAVYYGVYSSNRPELAGGYYQAINDYAPAGGVALAKSKNFAGTEFDAGIGPFGIISTPGDYDMKTDAVESALPYLKHYDYTLDTAWAERTAYPFLRLVADFWDNYLVWDPVGNRYVIKDSGVAEGARQQSFNAVTAVAYLHCFYRGLLKISHDLHKDSDKWEKWEKILAHLPAYPLIDYKGKKVFAFSEGSGAEENPYPYNLYPVFPTQQVGMDDPVLSQIARDTIATRDYWGQMNSFCEIYPAAVLCGYDPGIILAKMNALLTSQLRPNGVFYQQGGGIEIVGAIEAVNCMLLQSTEGMLKFFPVWDGSDARFVRLRAVGAFLVSAELKSGTVQNVTLTSEKGRRCRVKNPWAASGQALTVTTGGAAVAAVQNGDVYTFATRPGVTYELSTTGVKRTFTVKPK